MNDDWDDEQDDDICFDCADCGVDTNAINEYYVVDFDIWRAASKGIGWSSMLYIGCLEARIGRKLDSGDFLDVPVNTDPDWGPRSPRLQSRLQRPPRKES